MTIFKRKKITIKDEQTEELEAHDTWEVRWESRHGNYHSDRQPEIEVFTSEEGAKKFKQALVDAQALFGDTNNRNITVGRRKDK